VRRFNTQVEGAPAHKVHTIHYGLPLPVQEIDKRQARKALRDTLKIDADAPVIGMVCRLIDAKGIPDALQAFSRVASDYPDLHFVIAGDGPLRRDLEMLARSLRVSERVHFLGWRDDPMNLMAGLDILLMPSVREGFGMSMLEAMAHSIPIIGSTASAIPEVVANGENGLTVPPRSPAALSDALRTLLSDKPLRMHMGMLGEDRLERLFSADLMIDRTVDLYRKLLQ
jgi:glycosyltransferase involved in cell wall biosynthesis